ncbi:2-phospho-L-lactate guanylyltransferase [Parahaliea maris]|uniref:3-phospho-D-glycerate guanylyltransferase n=1 Tax=Parahaliea maris TaxID=2716870 RepID=A0A5C9A757_9GAMM|nr:2-phospho-L-lactate guanylyltransferase [Parahaliea maris]TXS95500.1 2-phospho-L-lactate guanylyltransferase [Parahaliea maris]
MLHVLLPLKDLVAAKTRLAGILSPSERRGLMQAMAEDVLAVLSSHPAADRLWLVSDDPGAALLAEHFHARHLAERALGCSGLNRVLAAACDRIDAGPGDHIMVLHADLPWLAARDVDAALTRYAAAGGLLLAPDRNGAGTNLMVFPAASRPSFRFGTDSCERHRQWAREAGVRCTLLQRKGTARDIDHPADIAQLLVATDIGDATRAWLDQPGLRARLTLAIPQAGSIQQGPAKAGTKGGYGA